MIVPRTRVDLKNTSLVPRRWNDRFRGPRGRSRDPSAKLERDAITMAASAQEAATNPVAKWRLAHRRRPQLREFVIGRPFGAN